MATSFQRLRESKLIADVRAFGCGRTLGEEWAIGYADFEELERLNVFLDDPSCIEEIGLVLDFCPDFLVDDIALELWCSESFARGFASGAMSIFSQAFPDVIVNTFDKAPYSGAA